MSAYKCPISIRIVYFSGTGGTKRIAEGFASALNNRGLTVTTHELDKRRHISNGEEDMLILLYPVYSFNAPRPIHEYIRALPYANNTPAVIISVSGGGEVTPNTASHVRCVRNLERKGYPVVYNKMLVMPSNIFIPTPNGLAIRLLKIIPMKTDKTINDLLSGVTHRTKPDLLSRVFSLIGRLESTKIFAGLFGKGIKANEHCTGCGWCASVCPQENIIMKNNVPVFGSECIMCLRCIYGCAQKSLSPGLSKFILLKQGYDLTAYDTSGSDTEAVPIEVLAKGYAFSGIKKYLLEKD